MHETFSSALRYILDQTMQTFSQLKEDLTIPSKFLFLMVYAKANWPTLLMAINLFYSFIRCHNITYFCTWINLQMC